MEAQRTRKAIALISGGLDSALAAAVVMEQGVEVIGFHLVNAFGASTRDGSVLPHVVDLAKELGIELRTEDSTDAMIEMVRRPKYARGKNLNPCIDCHIYDIQRAEHLRQELDADFILTGEVLGQRPLSQNREALNLINRKTGLADILLRPLSARLLNPTLPERSGWVDREKFPLIVGRGRKKQLLLATHYGLTQFGSPAGGCLLTTPQYCQRLAELMEREPNFGAADAILLRVGRHFRTPQGERIVVGRDIEENQEIRALIRPHDRTYQLTHKPGALVLLRPLAEHSVTEEGIHNAAGLAVFFSKGRDDGVGDVTERRPDHEDHILEHTPIVASQSLKSLSDHKWRVEVCATGELECKECTECTEE